MGADGQRTPCDRAASVGRATRCHLLRLSRAGEGAGRVCGATTVCPRCHDVLRQRSRASRQPPGQLPRLAPRSQALSRSVPGRDMFGNSTSRTTTLLYAARGVRGFGDGFAIIILPAYLSAIGFDAVWVGVVATASLLGSAVLTLAVGLLGARHDLRALLTVGAIVMVATGLAFPQSADIAFIALVAFIGTINPSTGDIGMLVPLEHATLARVVPDQARTRASARYSLIGALATAAGSLAAATPQFLIAAGFTTIGAFQAMCYAYAALGVVNVLLYRRLPHVEATDMRTNGSALGPSRGIVYRLAALFSLDAFAGGFIVQSLLALWLFERFELSLAAASLFFFWSSVLSAFSYPVAAWLARHIGLVNTMVFTHIPSSICLILAAVSPNLGIALTLLLVRS